MNRMTPVFTLVLLLSKSLLIAFPTSAPALERCSFQAEPVSLPNPYGELWLRWDLIPETDSLYEPVTFTNGPLALYRDWVSSNTETDPVFLLKKQRALYEKYGFAAELPVYDLVITGNLGTISPINCLQARLLEAHLVNCPHTENSLEEFEAFILKGSPDPQDPRHGHVRIFFHSAPGQGFVPIHQELYDLVAQDLKSGWSLAYHLHNHPFAFNNPAGDIAGTLIPSGGDRPTYLDMQKKYHLGGAWITNGFHTIEVPSSQFSLFPR